MNKNIKTGLLVALIVVAIGLPIKIVVNYYKAPGAYDGFAQCIADSGATFYGAFWCPHCQAQKAAFGKSAKLLPYKECSTPDGQGRMQVCIDEKVESYPTWKFADGSVLTGEQSLDILAEKTSCDVNAPLPLPETNS